MRGRCILNHRWVDRAPSAFAGSRSRGGARGQRQHQRPQPKSDMQNHMVPKCCTTHLISHHDGDSHIVVTIWCLSSGDPPVNGNLAELRRTAAFVRAIGISVWRTTTTKKKIVQSINTLQIQHKLLKAFLTSA